jgi:hypothetical protein
MAEGQAPAAPAASTQPTNTESQADISDADLSSLSGETSESGGSSGGSVAAAPQEVKNAQQAVDTAKNPKEKAKAQEKLVDAKRKFMLKVDGQETAWEGTDDDIKRELQLSSKARKEIQESAELKKEVMSLLAALKKDPAKVLADPAIGIDVKEFAKKILSKQLEDEMKSPQELEKEKLQSELEELRAKVKDDEDSRKQADYDRYVASIESDIEEKTQEALESSGLPKSPYILKRMTDVMISAINAGKDVTPKQALNIVKKEMHKDMKDMFSTSAEDLLEELIGSDNIKRINKNSLSKMRKATSSRVSDTGHVAPKADAKPKDDGTKKIKINDWLRGK